MTYESDRSKSRIIWFCSRSGPIEKHVMARNSRLTALDSLRGFGILLVVFGTRITVCRSGVVDFFIPHAIVLHHLRHVVPRKDNSSTRLRRRLQDFSYRICSSE